MSAFKQILIFVLLAFAMAAKAFTFLPMSRGSPTSATSMSMSCYNNNGYPMRRGSLFGRGMREMVDVMNQVEQLVDNTSPTIAASAPISASMMRMDVAETNNLFKIVVDLPGIEKKDIDIAVEDRRLTISVARPAPAVNEDDGEKFTRLERFSGEISRSLTLPETADAENIEAEVKNGVLFMKIPKVAEVDRTRKIEIK